MRPTDQGYGKSFAGLANNLDSLMDAVRGPALEGNLAGAVACRMSGCAWVLVIYLMATGCTTTVRLETGFPSPAIDPLPLRVAVFYEKEFRDYVYSAPRGADPLQVDLGPAQVRLLDQMFDGLFEEFSQTTSPPTDKNRVGVDVVIIPTIEGFTLSGPAYHGNGYYEVRLAYRLELYDRSGMLVGGLPVEGHARAPAAWTSLSAPVQQATIRALRDAAARIILELPEQPAILQLLESATAPNHG